MNPLTDPVFRYAMGKEDPRFKSIYSGFSKAMFRLMTKDEWVKFKKLLDKNDKAKELLTNHEWKLTRTDPRVDCY